MQHRSRFGKYHAGILLPGLGLLSASAWAASNAPTLDVGAILDNPDQLVGLFLLVAMLVGIFLIILGVQGLRANYYRPQSFSYASIAACLIAGALLISPWFLYDLIADTFDVRIIGADGVSAPPDNVTQAAHPLAIEPRLQGHDPSPGSFFARYIPRPAFKYLVTLINLLGVYFFLKGIYCWRYAGAPQKPQGYDRPIAKGVTHIIGAMFLINMLEVGCGLSLVFGSTMFCT